MAYLAPNSFYKAFKTKSYGSVPKLSGIQGPSTNVGLLGQPAPVASAPSAPAGVSGAPQGFTPTTAGLPPDPTYQAALAGYGKTREDTINNLLVQRNQGLSQYGYNASVDDKGNVSGVTYDPNNPYSQASLLRKNYQQSKTGNTNSYAAAGQLYAGSLQNAQNNATDKFQQGDNSLINALSAFLTNNQGAVNAANNAFDVNSGTAFGDMVQRAPDNPLYTAASNGGLSSAGPDGQTAVTAANGPLALVAQQPNSTVKLASGWSIVYGPDGKPIKFIPPGG
jgi:hypothetical protein